MADLTRKDRTKPNIQPNNNSVTVDDSLLLNGGGSMSIDSFKTLLFPYKIYKALLTQSGTQDPVAIVLENTLGDIRWVYNDIGVYYGQLSGAFTYEKTTSCGGVCNLYNSFYACFFEVQRDDLDTLLMYTTNSANSGSFSNDMLNNTLIEIKVYN
jgi:hypothetical protein